MPPPVILDGPNANSERNQHPAPSSHYEYKILTRNALPAVDNGGRWQSAVGGGRQGETRGGGLKERWTKAADGGCNGSQGPKRMDMWWKRCWAAATAQYLIFYLIIFTPGGLGTARGKSVGEESILTSLDKSDIRYSALIFSLESTWTQPDTMRKIAKVNWRIL